MFSSIIASVALSAIAIVGNPWAVDNWSPLQDRYAVCKAESLSALEYYECTAYWYEVATTNTVKA